MLFNEYELQSLLVLVKNLMTNPALSDITRALKAIETTPSEKHKEIIAEVFRE